MTARCTQRGRWVKVRMSTARSASVIVNNVISMDMPSDTRRGSPAPCQATSS